MLRSATEPASTVASCRWGLLGAGFDASGDGGVDDEGAEDLPAPFFSVLRRGGEMKRCLTCWSDTICALVLPFPLPLALPLLVLPPVLLLVLLFLLSELGEVDLDNANASAKSSSSKPSPL